MSLKLTQEIKQMCLDGIDKNIICEKAGISRGALNRYIREGYVTYTGKTIRHTKYTEAEKTKIIEEVIDPVKNGGTVMSVCRKYGTHRETISTWFKERNIDIDSYRSDDLSEENQKLLEEYCNKNLSIKKIANLMNMSAYQVSKYLSRYSLSTNGNQYEAKIIDDSETYNDIKHCLEIGMSQSEIARSYGVSTSRMHKYIVEKNFKRKSRAYPTPDILAEIRSMIARGDKLYEISRTLGICNSTLSNWIQRYDLRKAVK